MVAAKIKETTQENTEEKDEGVCKTADSFKADGDCKPGDKRCADNYHGKD